MSYVLHMLCPRNDEPLTSTVRTRLHDLYPFFLHLSFDLSRYTYKKKTYHPHALCTEEEKTGGGEDAQSRTIDPVRIPSFDTSRLKRDITAARKPDKSSATCSSFDRCRTAGLVVRQGRAYKLRPLTFQPYPPPGWHHDGSQLGLPTVISTGSFPPNLSIPGDRRLRLTVRFDPPACSCKPLTCPPTFGPVLSWK